MTTSHQHYAHAESLHEWELSLWWMGFGCLVLAMICIYLGMMLRGICMALLYWPIAFARDACGRAVEREVERLREDLVTRRESEGEEP